MENKEKQGKAVSLSMLASRNSADSECSSVSWSSGEISQRSSDSNRGYSSGEGGSYQCIATLSGHTGPVASLVVKGNAIFSGGSDGSDIIVWSQPEMTESFRVRAGGEGAAKALLVDGDKIFSAHEDRKIRVWRMPSGEIKRPKMIASLPTLKDYLLRCIPPKNYVSVRRHKTSLWIQHNDAISVLAKGAGDLLYSGSWDKSIKVWRTSDFRCVESITGHDDAVSALVTDQEGNLYSGSADASVRVWAKEGKKHTLMATLNGHKSSVNALAFNSDESLLYVASSDKTVSVWERSQDGDERRMDLVSRLKGHRQAVLCMAVVGDIVCTGSADKTVRVWRRSDRNNHSLVAVLEGHRGPVKSVCVSTEAVQMGVMVYSGSIDRTVKVWWVLPTTTSSQDDSSSDSSSPQSLKWKF